MKIFCYFSSKVFCCLKYDGLSNQVHGYLDPVEADYSLDLSLFLESEL